MQSGQADSKIEMINKRVNLLLRAERDAITWENSFDKNKTSEVEFYNK